MAEKSKKVEQSEDKPLVGEDGTAVSPIAEHPGQIRFPIPFTGHLYKTVTQTLGKAEGDWDGDFFSLLPYWRVVLAIATVELEGVDAGAPFDEQPVQVLRWARDAAIEYTDRFLTYTR